MVTSHEAAEGTTMTVRITRQDHSAAALRTEAARAHDGNAARRMLALAMVLEGHARDEAARLTGMDRQTLRDWVHRYNAEGLAGLVDRSAPGRRPSLSPEQMRALADIVEKGPDPEKDGVVRWRRVDLRGAIAARFGVQLHERTVGKLLAKLDMRRLSVRPKHPEVDLAAQEAFKKTSPAWCARLSPSMRPACRSRSGSRMRPASASRAP
jgi:transposase